MKLYALRYYSEDKYDQSNGYIGLCAGIDELKKDIIGEITECSIDDKTMKEEIAKAMKDIDNNKDSFESGYNLYISYDQQVYIQEMSDFSCKQAMKYANTQTEKQDGIVETEMMNINRIEVYVEKGQETNFGYRISKSEAERLFNTYKRLPFDVMCKEYGQDDDWVGMSIDDINEDKKFDDDYKTFEIY